MAAPRPAAVGRLSAPSAIRRGWLLPTAVFVGLLVIYVSTLTEVHTFDALSYVTSIERKPWTEALHPHHLAYGPLGTLVLSAGQVVGYQGGVALLMQVLNALAGALGAAIFCSTVRRVTRRADLALVASLLLGCTYAYWYYAIEIEVYTLAALFLIICLDLMSRWPGQSSWRQMLALGAAHGGAVLFHQTNVLLGIPVLVALLAYRQADPPAATVRLSPPDPSSVKHLHITLLSFPALIYVFMLTVIVAVPYLAAGFVISGFRGWSDFVAWMTTYARTGWWGGPITPQTWADLGKGVSDTFAQPGGAFLWLLLLGLILCWLPRRAITPRPLVLVAVSWLLVYGCFFLWWEPDNIEFWIASLPPAFLLIALGLRRSPRWGAAIWIALAIVVAAIGLNYEAIARRGDATKDLQRLIVHALGQHLREADLALIPDGLLELYLPYYEGHDVFLSLNQALFDAGGDWDTACASIRARVATTLHAGATVIAADEVLRPPSLVLQRHQLAQSDIEQCFEIYEDALRPLNLSAELPVYWRFFTGQERAESTGWRFTHFQEGWKASNITKERFAQGWHFTPLQDPSLTSPLLTLTAEHYQAIEIRMAHTTQAVDAQLFFSDAQGQIDENRSIRWTLAPTNTVQTYRLPLSGQAGWQGTITRLRLDPVGVGDGGEIIVEGVRLIPISQTSSK